MPIPSPHPVARLVVLLVLLAQARAHGQGEREALLAQCGDCHPSESGSYARTGMARALERLRPGELAGLAPVAEEGTGFVYSFEGDGAGARVIETHPGTEGAPFRDSAPIAFAIGAGELDRSFALKRGQRLWLAPLEVLGARHGLERHAALAPGHAMAPGTRFTQPVTPECLGCHTDRPPPRAWPLNRVDDEWEPRGISCGACHGALEEHVRARAAELAGEPREAADPLASERGWSRTRRMERCAACHLQGDARIELDPARLGPPPPGTPLLATRAVFVARQPSDEIGFVSHVQRLVLSRCYLESAGFPGGGLACESCHDPHRSVFEAEERGRVRAACLACHEVPRERGARASDCALPRAERPSARDCVDCHMRRTGVFDVAEVAIHDHWIRRAGGAPGAPGPLRFPESPQGDWRIFEWPGAASAGAGDDPGPWTMALSHGGHFERALEHLRRGEGARAAALPMLHHVRGSLLERAEDYAGARAAYERALALDPDLVETLVNLGPLLAHLGEARAGKERLDRVLARHPLADSAYRNRAAVRLALEDEPGFRADLEAAMKLNPDPALAQALARYCEQRGDASGARRWSAEARRLDPRVP
jgi:predicted CXXCH cytochrome family protein